jgi:hypothetical protein
MERQRRERDKEEITSGKDEKMKREQTKRTKENEMWLRGENKREETKEEVKKLWEEGRDAKKIREEETGEQPPLWSSGQSSWLQIRRPGFDSRHCQKKKSSGTGTGSTQPREYN